MTRMKLQLSPFQLVETGNLVTKSIEKSFHQ